MGKGSAPGDAEVKAFMQEMDFDQSGSIDYEEFIGATIHVSKLEKHSNMVRAFEFFDKNGDGFINAEEIEEGLKSSNQAIRKEEVDEIMAQVDKNGVTSPRGSLADCGARSGEFGMERSSSLKAKLRSF